MCVYYTNQFPHLAWWEPPLSTPYDSLFGTYLKLSTSRNSLIDGYSRIQTTAQATHFEVWRPTIQ